MVSLHVFSVDIKMRKSLWGFTELFREADRFIVYRLGEICRVYQSLT